jgi:hypothetical protein
MWCAAACEGGGDLLYAHILQFGSLDAAAQEHAAAAHVAAAHKFLGKKQPFSKNGLYGSDVLGGGDASQQDNVDIHSHHFAQAQQIAI